MKETPEILLLFCVYMVSVASFNIGGLTLTRYVSAVLRAIADVTRTLLVWLISLTITFYTKYTMENTNYKAIIL